MYYETKRLKIEMDLHVDFASQCSVADSIVKSSPYGHSPQPSAIRLPRLVVPTFSGTDLSEWPPFRDLFESVIHRNTALSNVEKFHYLIGQLTEPAKGIIKTLPMLDANYELAWQAIVKRFNSPRIIASYYLDKLFNLKPLSS